VTDMERIAWACMDLDPVLSDDLTRPLPAVHMPDSDADLKQPCEPLRLNRAEGVLVFWCGDRCGARVAVMGALAADKGEGLWFLPGHAPALRGRVGQRYVEKGLA
jgi:hypothetical protein